MEPFQKKKNGVPFKIERGTYIFSGPWDQVLYFDLKLTFKYSPFPFSVAQAGLFLQLNFGKRAFRKHEDWLVFYGCSRNRPYCIEEKLREGRKELYEKSNKRYDELEKENPRFGNPYHQPDPMKTSHCITLHKQKLLDEFRDA